MDWAEQIERIHDSSALDVHAKVEKIMGVAEGKMHNITNVAEEAIRNIMRAYPRAHNDLQQTGRASTTTRRSIIAPDVPSTPDAYTRFRRFFPSTASINRHISEVSEYYSTSPILDSFHDMDTDSWRSDSNTGKDGNDAEQESP